RRHQPPAVGPAPGARSSPHLESTRRPDRPRHMGAPENPTLPRRHVGLRRLGVLVVALLVAGVVALAISQLHLHRVGHALITASPGWIVLALVLMGLSLVLRSISWYATLLAA